jgi:hypothetical protein
MRLLYNEKDNKIYYTGNRGLRDGKIAVEFGELSGHGLCRSKVPLTMERDIVNPCQFKTINYRIMKFPSYQKQVEKNWVIFNSIQGDVKMIYSWWPLLIGRPVENEFVLEHAFNHHPKFLRFLRGSTNGIIIGDEIWFICHFVSDEHGRRYYYHIFVILDSTRYTINRYSNLFTFEGRSIEYCLGLVYFQNSHDFMIGYSVFDRETKYITLSIDDLNQHLDFTIA